MFNHINGNLYHYGANNPVRYVDPTGSFAIAIPFMVAGLEKLGEAVVVGICAYLTYKALENSAAEISKVISNARKKDCDGFKTEVFHVTGSKSFADDLIKFGSVMIDNSISRADNRFGKQFYVASDKTTVSMEASGSGFLVKFEMSKQSKILDLTNPCVAEKMGYMAGMSRESARNLVSTWNLSGYDAIKYPSEKNPLGSNYAVINPMILKPTGVEPYVFE